MGVIYKSAVSVLDTNSKQFFYFSELIFASVIFNLKMAAEKKRLNVVFKAIPESLEEPFLKEFPAYVEGVVRGEPGGFVLTPHYGERAEELYNFYVRPDDIWVLSFPKSGESIRLQSTYRLNSKF